MSQVLTQQYPLARSESSLNGEIELDSAAKLMEWFYRIRRWEMDIDLTVEGVPWALNGIHDWYARENVFDPSPDSGEPPGSERGLVNPLTFNWYGGDYVATLGDASLVIRLLSNYQLQVVDEVQTGWIANSFFIAGQADGSGLPLASSGIIIGAVLPASVAVTVDTSYNLVLYENAGDTGRWTGTIDIYPIEWWPYAPTSGGDPVFDSATGAQINPNVVID